MHPAILGHLAQDHVNSLIVEADSVRLARAALAERPGLRRRTGLRLIAFGERLAPECPQNVVHLFRTGRV